MLAVMYLTIATAGVIGAAPAFWSFPTAFGAGADVAAGIATVTPSAAMATSLVLIWLDSCATYAIIRGQLKF